jgi:uncharacterized protein GlcG (DUF336 family)
LPEAFTLCSPAAVQQFLSRSKARIVALAATVAALLHCAPAQAAPQLTQEEVALIVAQAVKEAKSQNRGSIIAVTDREGFVLALWDVNKKLPQKLPPFPIFLESNLGVVKAYGLVAAAVTRASTAAFLSSDENAFTTRTAGYIIQQHFPVGVRNAPPGPLVGVGFSSLFFTDVNRVKLIPPGFVGNLTTDQLIASGQIATFQSEGAISPGIRAPLFPLTSLNDSPGGVPLYKGGHLVGGIGVTGDGDPTDLTPAAAILFKQGQKNATTGYKVGRDTDEQIALAGQTNFRPSDENLGSNVIIAGIRVPYVHPRPEDIRDVDADSNDLNNPDNGQPIDIPLNLVPRAANPLPEPAAFLVPPPLTTIYRLDQGTVASGFPQASPAPYPYEVARLGGFEGEIRFPFRDDPKINDTNPNNNQIRGVDRLTKEEVKDIISLSAERALMTRAGIRLPIGTSAKTFIVVVANPNKPAEPPPILGIFRTGEATVFSLDVAAQKARTALFFSNSQLAMSSRSVGFLAQRFFPPGIDGTSHGPYFGFQEAVTLRRSPTPPNFFPGNPNLPNGITIFPGGFPLYKDGVVVGAIGISGDGVDQDDIIGISGTIDFRPELKIRADNYTYRGARLPYVKFPRDPVK